MRKRAAAAAIGVAGRHVHRSVVAAALIPEDARLGQGRLAAMPDDEANPSPSVQLSLDGFEGPLDLLLELARRQAVDLRQISVSALVDQYLAATAEIARLDLGLAADWLVMTAWLVWLKSRLLLPKDPEEARQAGEAAKVLTERLRMLDNVRAAAAWLDRQPQLGREMFGRGRQGEVAPIKLETDLVDLFRAALAVLRARWSGCATSR